MTSSSTASNPLDPSSFKAEVIKTFEQHIRLAMETADFKLFKSAVAAMDATLHQPDDFAPGDVPLPTPKGSSGHLWNMRTTFASESNPAFIGITTAPRFLPGHADMIKMLVDRGLDLEATTPITGSIIGSPVSSAIRTGTPELLKFLMDLGASPNGPNGTNGPDAPSVQDAASLQESDMWIPLNILLAGPGMPGDPVGPKLQVLLDAGASMDVLRQRTKKTPLAIAAGSARWDAVLTLLQLGEDPIERSPVGKKKNAFEAEIDKLLPAQKAQMSSSMTAWLDARGASQAIDRVLQEAQSQQPVNRAPKP